MGLLLKDITVTVVSHHAKFVTARRVFYCRFFI